MSTRLHYRELGADYFDQRNKDALARRLVKRFSTLGYAVALEPLAA